ncbi:MAG: hypothetical protein DMG42_23625 [Acidobacteria bacterium]|nr:MAG: hypothetical protein AUH13_19215 [Acidobacteria bacterium 13_2_20CM_58_27]PYT68716.1 MAG: hypothetical protein DMG42_23625 [Acidobacteriota bacterium]
MSRGNARKGTADTTITFCIRKINRGYENFKLRRPGGMRIILLRTGNGSPAVNPDQRSGQLYEVPRV